MDVCWCYIALGLYALVKGQHPSADPYGGPWPADSYQAFWAGKEIAAGKFNAGLWAVSGDLEYAVTKRGGSTLVFEQSVLAL